MKLRVPLLPVLACVTFGLIDVWFLAMAADAVTNDDQAAAVMARPDIKLPASVDEVAARQPIDAYKETTARPVFFKNRQPYVPPPPPPLPAPTIAAPAPVVIDPGFAIGGVMIEKDRKKAYLFTKSNPSGTWTGEGEDFSGWKVTSVTSDGATLEQQGRTIDVLLYPRTEPAAK